MGSGVPLWNLLQSEPFGSSEAYATVGVAAAAELAAVADTALAEDEDESALLGAGLVGAAEAYVARATSGVIANNIVGTNSLKCRCLCRRSVVAENDFYCLYRPPLLYLTHPGGAKVKDSNNWSQKRDNKDLGER